MQGGEIWVLNPGEESLAFSMASAGYEVWVGNSRSSNYTYGHVTYSRQDKVIPTSYQGRTLVAVPLEFRFLSLPLADLSYRPSPNLFKLLDSTPVPEEEYSRYHSILDTEFIID